MADSEDEEQDTKFGGPVKSSAEEGQRYASGSTEPFDVQKSSAPTSADQPRNNSEENDPGTTPTQDEDTSASPPKTEPISDEETSASPPKTEPISDGVTAASPPKTEDGDTAPPPGQETYSSGQEGGDETENDGDPAPKTQDTALGDTETEYDEGDDPEGNNEDAAELDEDEGGEEEDLEFIKSLQKSQEEDEDEDKSPEDLEAEEAEFREKYALNMGDEGGEEYAGQPYPQYAEYGGEDVEHGEEQAPPPTKEQMEAIIRFLEEEEAAAAAAREAEEAAEAALDLEQTIAHMKNFGDKLRAQYANASERLEDASEMFEGTEVTKKESRPRGPTKEVEEGEPNVMVLGPDHPKMQRFQKALKEHLQRQVYAAECEIRNLENELKMKKKERTDRGTSLYNLQHEMLKQSEAMEKYERDAGRLKEKRDKTEAKTRQLKLYLVSVKTNLQKEEEKEMSLRESIKTLDFTEHIVKEAAEKYDGELKTRQLIEEKLEKMKLKTEVEKRDQDYYLDKVLTHVQHMELVNAGIRRQIEAHREEQKELSSFINEAVTEIDALQIEKLQLKRAWNETIAVVKSRDDALIAARAALQKTDEEVRIRESELRSITRLIAKEQEGHEKSVVLLRRRRMEERILKNQLQKLLDQNETLKDQLVQLNRVKQQADKDLLRATNALQRKQKEISAPRKHMEKLALEKTKLEDDILQALHEKTGLSKAASHIQSLIKEARVKSRSMENEVARVEHESSVLAIEVEKLRADLFKKTSTLAELEKRCSAQEKVLVEQLKDISQSERLIQKKSTESEKLTKKLAKLISQQGGSEVGPMEQEIDDLEKSIVAEKELVNKLQEEWLKRQDDLVRLTTQRDAVIQQNELLRKEVFIMERKRQRLDTEVEKRTSEINKVKKATEVIRSEISVVNAKLHEDRSNHDQMDKDNILIQNELMALLKDAETEAFELEGEISGLENEKQTLFQNLTEVHEQNLQWEKKVHLAKELKASIKKEQEGSTSSLKLEIHHMQVRYSEIMRTQEKLIGDLERCVERRDRVIERADLALKRDNANPKNTKLNIQRTFHSIKERNRLLIREASEVEQEVHDAMIQIKELEDKLNETSNTLNKVREAIHGFEANIAEASIQKHKNLVEIVLRQEKYRILESIKYNRYKPSGKTLEDIQALLEQSEKECYALVSLSDEIAKEHPETSTHVKLVKASILPSIT